ncbi:hypothetical protein D3C81_1344380 [compost metagenome]
MRDGAVQIPGEFLVPPFAADQNLIQQRIEGVAQSAGRRLIARQITADNQLRAPCQRSLALLITVDDRTRRLSLSFTLENLTQQLPVQHRVSSADHQLPGIATHGVTRLCTTGRCNQRVVERAGLAPPLTVILVALVQTVVELIPRRTRDFIKTTVCTAQPALSNLAALHIEGAAGQVDQ